MTSSDLQTAETRGLGEEMPVVRRRALLTPWRSLVGLYLVVVCLFSIGPMLVVMGASVSATDYLTFPPVGLSLRWYAAILTRPEIMAVLQNSLIVAAATVVFALLLSLAAAYAMVRYRWRGRTALVAFLVSPLLLPGVVIGFALVRFFGTIGFPLSLLTLIVAHVVVTLPYSLRTIMATLVGLDRSLEEAAWVLGAPPLRTFWEVILPLVKPGMVAGAVFVFITSFDNVVVSLFLVGPRFNTLPLWMLSYIEWSSDSLAAAISSVVTLASILVVVLVDRLVGLRNYLYAVG